MYDNASQMFRQEQRLNQFSSSEVKKKNAFLSLQARNESLPVEKYSQLDCKFLFD